MAKDDPMEKCAECGVWRKDHGMMVHSFKDGKEK